MFPLELVAERKLASLLLFARVLVLLSAAGEVEVGLSVAGRALSEEVGNNCGSAVSLSPSSPERVASSPQSSSSLLSCFRNETARPRLSLPAARSPPGPEASLGVDETGEAGEAGDAGEDFGELTPETCPAGLPAGAFFPETEPLVSLGAGDAGEAFGELTPDPCAAGVLRRTGALAGLFLPSFSNIFMRSRTLILSSTGGGNVLQSPPPVLSPTPTSPHSVDQKGESRRARRHEKKRKN